MKLHSASQDNAILDLATAEECGLWLWLAKRFEGKTVKIEFDTLSGVDGRPEPHVWLWVQEKDVA